MSSLTAANSVLVLTIPGVFDAPTPIQGYAVDDAFEGAAVQQAEVMMGVDGRQSAGKVFAPYPMTIHIQADSSSAPFFDGWRAAQDAVGDVYIASGTIYLPGTGMTYTLQSGVLTSATPFPAVKKILQPLVYEISWERIVPVGG